MDGHGECATHNDIGKCREKLCAVTRLFLINNLNAISNLEDIHIFIFCVFFSFAFHFPATTPLNERILYAMLDAYRQQ